MSYVCALRHEDLTRYLARRERSSEGWEVHVSSNTGRILRYTHATHGRVRTRVDVLRILNALVAGPSRPVVISSDEDDDDRCPVCLDDLDDDAFRLGRCGHRFCGACIGRRLETSDALHPRLKLPPCPTCMAAKWSSGGVVTPAEVDALHRAGHVDDRARARLHKAMALAVFDGDHHVTCPECTAVFVVQPGTVYKVMCPHCRCLGLCARCMTVHPGSCLMQVDAATSEMHACSVACPGTCGFVLQKRDDACNHLKCPKCNTDVCCLCGEVCTPDHFFRAGTPCYQSMFARPEVWAARQAGKANKP